MSDAKVKLYVYQGPHRVGLVREIISLQWMPEWANAGEIKLVCALTDRNRKLLQMWSTLYNPDTPDLSAVILAMTQDAGKTTITVRGKFSLYRFSQRLITGCYNVTDAAAGVLDVCRANLRNLPITIPDSATFSAPCIDTVEWTDCCSAIIRLARAGGFGARVRFNKLTGAESLELIQGKDRSVQGSDWYHGYLGSRLHNLPSPSLVIDASDYANVAICRGEKPTEKDTWQQITVEVGDTAATGGDRHELWVDGSSVTHRHTIQNPDGSVAEGYYTEMEYEAALKSYAMQELLNHCLAQSLKATATNSIIRYGDDYDLGDRLPIRVPELGLVASAQVIKIKLIYEATGRKITPVFDNIGFGGIAFD